jgi:hypothetical protein
LTVGVEFSALHSNGIIVSCVLFLRNGLDTPPKAARQVLLHFPANCDPDLAIA